MGFDKAVTLEEVPFSTEDKKELRRQNVIFLGGVSLLSLLALIVVFLLLHSTMWRLFVAIGFLTMIGIFASSVYSNFIDLKYGNKIIRTGRIWDIYEDFSTEKLGDKHVGKSKFFFRVGDLKHKYYQYSFDKDIDEEEPEEASSFKVDQVVEVHFTKSGYQLKEKIVKEAGKEGLHEMRVVQKIKSKRYITQFSPRKWNEDEKGEYFYLLVYGVLFPVQEHIFDNVIVGAQVDAETDVFVQNSFSLRVKNLAGDWLQIESPKDKLAI